MEEGVGEVGSDRVFQPSSAALVMTDVIERDNRMALLQDRTVRGWGDRVARWLVAERGIVAVRPGEGLGARRGPPRRRDQCAGALPADQPCRAGPHARRGRRPVLGRPPEFYVGGETDRLALTAMDALRGKLIGVGIIERWLSRLVARARPDPNDPMRPFRVQMATCSRSCWRCICSRRSRPSLPRSARTCWWPCSSGSAPATPPTCGRAAPDLVTGVSDPSMLL